MDKRNTSKFAGRRWQLCFTLIMMSSLLAGCRFPWQPSPEATDESESAVTAQAQVSTAAQRKDLPPALVEVAPLGGSVIALQQPITLYFNQAMDADSVEAALHFEPALEGSFTWEDDQTLIFTPDHPLSPETDLTLTINTRAQAANHESLPEPVEVRFTTTGDLRVAQAVPAEGTQDVDPESVIFIAFNQPVAPLGGETEAEPAFTLSPEVPGAGYWLNTSTYIFPPEPSMAGGTTYIIHLNEDLQSTTGAQLDPSQAVTSTFSTTDPQVVSVQPRADELLSLGGPVELQFNIRMDAESVEEQFALMDPTGAAVPGSFAWDEDWKTLRFTPDAVLARNASYTITLGAAATSYGGLPLGAALEAARVTEPVFSTDPYQAPEFENYYSSFGQYRLYFTTPLDEDTYQDHLTISPEVSIQNMYLSNGGTNLSITGYFEPESQYTVTLAGGLTDQWGGILGEPVTYTFATPPATASLSIITGETAYNLVFIPASASELVLQATNINTLTLEIAPISMEDLATLLHPDNFDYRQVFMPESVETSTRNLDLTRNISQVVTVPLSYQGNPLAPGVYFLAVSSPDVAAEGASHYQKLYLVVSENHLVMKVSPEQALLWATRLSDNAPLVNAPVSVFTTEGNLLASGNTDSDGLFTGDFARFDAPYTSFFAVAGEPGEADFAFSISTWGQSYTLYEKGIRFDSLPAQTDAYIYTDRAIYRPGDAVYFKAVIFDRENGIPVRSELDAVSVALYGDPGMSGMPATLYDDMLTLSDFGTVEGSVTLPQEAPPGYYWIEVAQGEDVVKSLYFEVAAYRKPEIEVAVDLTPEALVAGETLRAAVQADYYFGLPASGLSFSWALYRDGAYFSLPGYRAGPANTDWLMPQALEYSALGTVVASGSGETDAQGHARLVFTDGDLALDAIPEGSTQKYHLEVTVVDDSGFTVNYRDSALVHPDDFYIGVQPEAYYGVAEAPFNFSIQTADWEGQSVGGKAIQATFETIEWEVEATSNLEQPYQYVEQTGFVTSSSPVTGADGKARVSFTPETPGTYRLTLTSGGAVTQVVIWVSGSASAVWPRQAQNQIELTPDADAYQPGQIAQVFFPNPFPDGAKALITVERGEVMDTQVIELTGAGYTAQIPLTAESIPNVYVSVLLLGQTEHGDPDYRQGVVNLTVTPVEQTLNVALTVDPETTEPGETVSATLTITDAQGNPVQGEFSVAVVDKAVLALVEPISPSILEALYGEQPLSVQTSASLSTYATQLTLSSMDLGRGGGGGDEVAYETIREDFPDTAFWRADVVTGTDGTARLEIPMPDSLTTWVVDVRGLTETYQVGQAEAEVLTQKALMVRPVTPRFLVEGDEVQMGAVVHNNTAGPLTVEVSLQSTGFTLTDPAQQTQTVDIDPADSVQVNWWGTVESVAAAGLVFRAEAGALSDASRPTWGELQVLRFSMPQTFSTAGQLTDAGQRLELVSLPVSVDPSAGTLTLELTPTLTSTLIAGIEALETADDWDTVSILSRLLANLNAYLALSDLAVDSPQLQASLEELVTSGVRQLLDAQNADGGWSWWSGSGNLSDPFITAYVLLGLDQAAEAGMDVNDYILERAVTYLTEHLEEPGEIDTAWQLDRLAFQSYVLRNSGVSQATALEGLYARRSELSPWAEALLALTLHETGGAASEVSTLLTDLETRAVRSATGVHWESEKASWLLPGTPNFNTAVGIYVLAQLDPASTSLPLALRYLLAMRQSDDLWASTFETGWSLMAITAALQGTGDYRADFEFSATLNDTLIAEGATEGADQLNSVGAIVEIGDLYPNSSNALLIERGEGQGTLYYRVDLETYQLAATAAPVNQGISLSREYYLSGEGCPGAEGCTPIESLVLDPDDPTQMITVVLTIHLSNAMVNLMIEDFIPAGTEVIDPTLLTSQTLTEAALPLYDPRAPFANGWGWWLFNDPQIYDDHLLWTADYVPAGTYTLAYRLLPFQRGVFQIIPAHAWQYFFPEVQGTSAGDVFTIE